MYSLFVSDFIDICLFMTDFRNTNIKCHENPSSGSQIAPRGWTDRQTWRSLIVDFHNFAKAPKNQSSYRKFLIPFTQSKPKWAVKALWFSSSCTVRIVTPIRWGSGNDSDLIKLVRTGTEALCFLPLKVALNVLQTKVACKNTLQITFQEMFLYRPREL
jgi:hypothetical protein